MTFLFIMFICPLKDKRGAFHLFKSWTGISSPEVPGGGFVGLTRTPDFAIQPPDFHFIRGNLLLCLCIPLSRCKFALPSTEFVDGFRTLSVLGCRQDREACSEHTCSSVVTPFCSLYMLHFSFCGLWRYDLVCVGRSTEGKIPGMKSKVVTITSGI